MMNPTISGTERGTELKREIAELRMKLRIMKVATPIMMSRIMKRMSGVDTKRQDRTDRPVVK